MEQLQQENELLQKQNQALQKEISQFTQTVPDKNEEMEAYERMAEQNITFTQCAKQLSAKLIEQHQELRILQQGEVKHLSDIDWNRVYQLIDIQCCCLIKLQLSTSAIARLYSIAPSSVTKCKQRIKERINQTKKGLLGKEQSVDVCIWGGRSILSVTMCYAQKIRIGGKVMDGSTNTPAEFANVVLQTLDSAFVTGASTDMKGHFQLEKIQEGNYRLIISAIGYTDFITDLNGLSKSINLNNLVLNEATELLEEVTVTASNIINQTDRKIIFPNQKQLAV